MWTVSFCAFSPPAFSLSVQATTAAAAVFLVAYFIPFSSCRFGSWICQLCDLGFSSELSWTLQMDPRIVRRTSLCQGEMRSPALGVCNIMLRRYGLIENKQPLLGHFLNPGQVKASPPRPPQPSLSPFFAPVDPPSKSLGKGPVFVAIIVVKVDVKLEDSSG